MKDFIFDELDLLIFILSGLIKIVIGSFTFINEEFQERFHAQN